MSHQSKKNLEAIVKRYKMATRTSQLSKSRVFGKWP